MALKMANDSAEEIGIRGMFRERPKPSLEMAGIRTLFRFWSLWTPSIANMVSSRGYARDTRIISGSRRKNNPYMDNKILKLMEEVSTLKVEISKQDSNSKLQMAQVQLKWEIDNYLHLRALQDIHIRSFLDLADRRWKIFLQGGSRRVRLSNFSKNNSMLIKEWKLDPKNFAEKALTFYRDMCESAHPLFRTDREFIIDASGITDEECRIVGVIWEEYPLPLSHLVGRKGAYHFRMETLKKDAGTSYLHSILRDHITEEGSDGI